MVIMVLTSEHTSHALVLLYHRRSRFPGMFVLLVLPLLSPHLTEDLFRKRVGLLPAY